MFIVTLLMIPKGRVRAWSTILTVMAVMTGGTQLVEGAHFVASQANQVKSTKTDEFSEKFQTAFGSPPSFSENYVAFFLEMDTKPSKIAGTICK